MFVTTYSYIVKNGKTKLWQGLYVYLFCQSNVRQKVIILYKHVSSCHILLAFTWNWIKFRPKQGYSNYTIDGWVTALGCCSSNYLTNCAIVVTEQLQIAFTSM